jgi:hypothetical protein
VTPQIGQGVRVLGSPVPAGARQVTGRHPSVVDGLSVGVRFGHRWRGPASCCLNPEFVLPSFEKRST